MAKQKKDFGLIVWAFGWLLAIAVCLKKFTAELQVSFDAFERLGSPEGEATMKKVIALVRDDWAATQPRAEEPPKHVASVPDAIDIFDWVRPVPDAELSEPHKAMLAKYRREDAGYHAYRVSAGYALKTHAARSGPCDEDFAYLQGWNFPDEATKDCIVFWAPRIAKNSASKTKDQQIELLANLRTRLGLPAHHMSGFGTPALLAGLILAHYKATGERVLLDQYWVRTDICRADGYRLRLFWSASGLSCGFWFLDGEAYGRVGVFALGVEALGS